MARFPTRDELLAASAEVEVQHAADHAAEGNSTICECADCPHGVSNNEATFLRESLNEAKRLLEGALVDAAKANERERSLASGDTTQTVGRLTELSSGWLRMRDAIAILDRVLPQPEPSRPFHEFDNGVRCYDQSRIVWANGEDCLHEAEL